MIFKSGSNVRANLIKARTSMARAAAFPVSVAVKCLPRLVRIIVASNTKMVGLLDYESADVRLHVDSLTEYGRLKSCRKEPGTVAWLKEFMGKDDVLYDIGANVGAYTLIAAQSVKDGTGKVVAFEPSFRNFSRLNENIGLNGLTDHVIPVSLALSDSEEIVNFRFSSDEIGAALHNMDGSTIRRNARASVSSMSVLSVRLDDVVKRYGLPHPTLIKLDVDGPEFEVLVGAGDLLSDPRLKTILVEVEPDEQARAKLKAYLEAKGWTLHSRNHHFGNAVDEDWIWVRS